MANKFKTVQKSIMTRQDEIEEKFVNYLMKEWKKSVALRILHKTISEIRNNWHMNVKIVIRTAIDNASPTIMVKSARVWWSVYQVPVEVKPKKRFYFACNWILKAARNKKWSPMYKKLAEEILAAYSWQWFAVKKREEAQKMAEANKAFAYMAKYVH